PLSFCGGNFLFLRRVASHEELFCRVAVVSGDLKVFLRKELSERGKRGTPKADGCRAGPRSRSWVPHHTTRFPRGSGDPDLYDSIPVCSYEVSGKRNTTPTRFFSPPASSIPPSTKSRGVLFYPYCHLALSKRTRQG